MKKKLVAVGLAATLALGAVPALAFAAEGDGPFVKNDAETTVKVVADTSNLSATVPLVMQGSIPTIGGASVYAEASAYGITNNSATPIHVAKLEAKQGTGVGLNFEIKKEAQTASSTTTAKYAALQIIVKAGAGDADNTYTTSMTSGETTFVPKAWDMEAKTTETEVALTNKLPITITGTNSIVKDGDKIKDTPQEAVKYIYTIAAGKAPVQTP